MLTLITIILTLACGSPSDNTNQTSGSEDRQVDTVVVVHDQDEESDANDDLNEKKKDTLESKADKTAPKSEQKREAKEQKKEQIDKKPKLVDHSDIKDTVEKDSAPVEQTAPPAEAAPQMEHAIWDELLRNHVSADGSVDYKALKGKEDKLDKYLQKLSNNPPESGDSRNYVMSYWINAYNAFTVKKILQNYPVKSIKNISGGNVWDVKWIEIGGEKYSLNQIENEILRKEYKDARIHFAVNCAAISCPPLLNQAYKEGNLERLLERQTKSFIQNDRFNTITPDKIEVSKVFDWYGEDFGNVADYVNRYTDVSVSSDAKVKFKNYDWGLNGK